MKEFMSLASIKTNNEARMNEWLAEQKSRLSKAKETLSDNPEALYAEYASICESAIETWGDSYFPTEFLKLTLEAFKTQDWTMVSQAFMTETFIHSSGYFILAGPYSVLRKG